jgi:hypothetical protein
MSVEDFYRTKYTYDDRCKDIPNKDKTYSVRKFDEDLKWSIENEKPYTFHIYGDILFNVSVIIKFANKEHIESYINQFNSEFYIDWYTHTKNRKEDHIKYVPNFHVNDNILTISVTQFAVPIVTLTYSNIDMFIPKIKCNDDIENNTYHLYCDYVWIWNAAFLRKLRTYPIIINISGTKDRILINNGCVYKSTNGGLFSNSLMIESISETELDTVITCEDSKFHFLNPSYISYCIKAVPISADLSRVIDDFLRQL